MADLGTKVIVPDMRKIAAAQAHGLDIAVQALKEISTAQSKKGFDQRLIALEALFAIEGLLQNAVKIPE